VEALRAASVIRLLLARAKAEFLALVPIRTANAMTQPGMNVSTALLVPTIVYIQVIF